MKNIIQPLIASINSRYFPKAFHISLAETILDGEYHSVLMEYVKFFRPVCIYENSCNNLFTLANWFVEINLKTETICRCSNDLCSPFASRKSHSSSRH